MSLHDQVSQLMRQVADEVVLPNYRCLRQAQVYEKSPGEVVTSVDLESERRLAAGLRAALPSARVVGEEAAAADPSLLGGIGEGAVWLIDPLDGTRNYASGSGPFGMMVALVIGGITQMGWMLDPRGHRMSFAERGKGAWCGGLRVRCHRPMRARPVAALGTHFLSPARREQVHAAARPHFERVPVPMCAAESYPRLVLGRDDVLMFQRILPWDHAAGALFVTEAGGHVSHWDRSPYRVGGDGVGVIAAATHDLWDLATGTLAPAALSLAPEIERAA
ncbi:inositol monophosphatase family protein [Aurantiacibacter hainanensis]|uniref:inositol monophosphatase family protein n=1 Tax=Aurantiacibacter hainanensis TaxID=3076114 RepID=UPI0030C6A9C6